MERTYYWSIGCYDMNCEVLMITSHKDSCYSVSPLYVRYQTSTKRRRRSIRITSGNMSRTLRSKRFGENTISNRSRAASYRALISARTSDGNIHWSVWSISSTPGPEAIWSCWAYWTEPYNIRKRYLSSEMLKGATNQCTAEFGIIKIRGFRT